jgi:hypothetical protein
MRDILKGIAVIIGLGLVLILAVAFIHAHGPMNRPLFMTQIDSVMRKHQPLVPATTAGGIPAAAAASNTARTVTVCTPGAVLATHNPAGEAAMVLDEKSEMIL